jgi:CRP/FNR family transcriptional regulator, cyclic AMP receptor protein
VNSPCEFAGSSITPPILPPVPAINLFRSSTDAEDVAEGVVLFKEGDPGESMVVVIDGAVDVMLGDHVVETVHPGGIVGEMALIDDAPRSASAVTSAPSRVLHVDKQRFTFLVQEHPTFALQVMAEMAARLRRMDSWAESGS